ncbi:MAG: NAD(P)-dependent oxidoreductase [Clostridia bacterium]|nr:NAD(P)-dependent oxidoreductase [Clostridia bacterium]
MKRAVITGATGAIGRALIDELIQNGIEVLALCRRGKRTQELPTHKLLSIQHCALSELSALQQCNTEKPYDVFYHLAWDGTNGAARNNPDLQCDNIRYALDAVLAARRLGCHTFIGAGSQAEYGRVSGSLTPSTPTFPESGYGMAKLAAGGLTRLAASACGMRHIWVRILSVYGPHDNEKSLVSSTILKLMHGNTPQFTKGEQLWDFLYSRDAARALSLLGERGKDGAIYPLGSGVVRPLKDYLLILRDIVSPHTPLQFGAIPYSKDQVMHLCADLTAITADTGWTPVTSFCEGIRQTVAWWQIQEKISMQNNH